MPFQRPTLKELKERAAADLDSRLPGSDARLRRSNTNVLAMVHSGAVHGLHGHLDFLSKQIIPDTAESEFLDRWASIWKVARKAAAAATGMITFTGTNGAVVPAGTSLRRSDGAEFAVSVAVAIAAGTATAEIVAAEPGVAGNTVTGSALTLANPIAGVNPTASVAAGDINGGTDSEDDDDLRIRLLTAIRQPPHGGAAFDYVNWALEVAGVTRAWSFPNFWGPGTVGVAVVCDDQVGSIIPDPEKIQEVQDHIDFLRPVTADVTVWAPIEKPLDITITLNPTNALVQAAVEAELLDLITREAVPNGTIYLSHIREAVSIAAGEIDHTLYLPAADVVCEGGEISTLGVITWV
jgi:uncharacterized phage protein gp47/JayE